MSYYRYCPKCGKIYLYGTKECNVCQFPTEETDIAIPDDCYVSAIRQRMENEIFTKYKIKENPLYSEEAVKHRQEEEERKHRERDSRPSAPYIPPQQNVPKCPTCGSTNVNKISGAKKAAGFITVGVFSSNFGKTMECKNCGYKW